VSEELFITATSIDFGKTVTSVLIVKKFRGNGLNSGYYKTALNGTENTK
jgi:dethiobiotin synthetase